MSPPHAARKETYQRPNLGVAGAGSMCAEHCIQCPEPCRRRSSLHAVLHSLAGILCMDGPVIAHPPMPCSSTDGVAGYG